MKKLLILICIIALSLSILISCSNSLDNGVTDSPQNLTLEEVDPTIADRLNADTSDGRTYEVQGNNIICTDNLNWYEYTEDEAKEYIEETLPLEYSQIRENMVEEVKKIESSTGITGISFIGRVTYNGEVISEQIFAAED